MKRRNALLVVLSVTGILGAGMSVHAEGFIAIPDFESYADGYDLESTKDYGKHGNTFCYDIDGDLDTMLDLALGYAEVLEDFDFDMVEYRSFPADYREDTQDVYMWFDYRGSGNPDTFDMTPSSEVDYTIDDTTFVMQMGLYEDDTAFVILYMSKDYYGVSPKSSLGELPDFTSYADGYILERSTENKNGCNFFAYEIQREESGDLTVDYLTLLDEYDFELDDIRIYEDDAVDEDGDVVYAWFDYTGSGDVGNFNLTLRSRDDYEIEDTALILMVDFSDNDVIYVDFYISKDINPVSVNRYM